MSNNYLQDSTIMRIMEIQGEREQVDVSLDESDDVMRDVGKGPSNRGPSGSNN